MGADPFTPAELEAAARALRHVRHVIASDGYPSIRIGTDEEDATVVLEAVAPLIAARVRAEAVEGIAQAAAIARAHRTTPGGDDHA